MKKIIILGSFLISLCAESAIDIKDYCQIIRKQEQDIATDPSKKRAFTRETDLIAGKVLINSGILKSARFYGPISYNYRRTSQNINKSDSCSHEDKALSGNQFESLSNLLIHLFPSTSDTLSTLNPRDLGINSREDFITFIVNLFKISDAVRKNSQTLKEIRTILNRLTSYNKIIDKINKITNDKPSFADYDFNDNEKKILSENIQRQMKGKIDKLRETTKKEQSENELAEELMETLIKKQLRQLINNDINRQKKLKKEFWEKSENLNSVIADISEISSLNIKKICEIAEEVIAVTESEESNDASALPEYFANYVISAYAWSVLESQDLPDLQKKLAENFSYTSKPYINITEDFDAQERNSSFFPFENGMKSSTEKLGCFEFPFSDCAETAVKCLLIAILSKKTDDPENEFIIDLDRIPDSSQLKEFFSKHKNLRQLVLDNSLETRVEWAKIVSNIEGIMYTSDIKEKPTISTSANNSDSLKSEGSAVKENHFELFTDLGTALKVICYLLGNDYKTDDKVITKCIEYVNKARKNGIPLNFEKINKANEDDQNPEEKEFSIVEILNNLLKIRQDVALKFSIISHSQIKLKSGEGFLHFAKIIKIWPESNEENKLLFGFSIIHAALKDTIVPPPVSKKIPEKITYWPEKIYFENKEDPKYSYLEYLFNISQKKLNFQTLDRIVDQSYYDSLTNSEKISKYIGISRLFTRSENTFKLGNIVTEYIKSMQDELPALFKTLCELIVTNSSCSSIHLLNTNNIISQNFLLAAYYLVHDNPPASQELRDKIRKNINCNQETENSEAQNFIFTDKLNGTDKETLKNILQKLRFAS